MPLIARTRAIRRKPVFRSSVLSFLLANTITALSGSIALSLAGRFVAGAFSGLAWAMMAGYARRIAVPENAGRALAIASLGTPLGLALGTPLGFWVGRPSAGAGPSVHSPS